MGLKGLFGASDEIEMTLETGIKGDKGDPGITPTIGENGNWYYGDVDSGKPSRGAGGGSDLTPDEALEVLDETGVACAVADASGALYTDSGDKIYIY